MRKNRNIVIFPMIVGCFLVLCGCGKTVNTDETQVVTLVSTEEFKIYYEMEEGIVPDEYLETFIERRGLTKGELAERNYDVMVKKLYDSDVVYEASIYTLISGEKISDMENVELENLSHIIMLNDLSVDGTDLKTAEYIVLDIEKQKLWISQNDITSNYESAENVSEVEVEWIRECFREIKDILLTEKSAASNGGEASLLDWHIYFVQKDKNVAMFSGTIQDTDTEIYEWYQNVLENVTEDL